MRSEPEAESPAAFQRIAPQPPALAARAAAATDTTTTADRRIPASRFVLGLLLVLLFGGITLWGLPRLLQAPPSLPEASAPATGPEVVATAPAPAAPTATTTPTAEAWDDPELLQARAAAQAAQARYQSDLQQLQRSGAQDWAATELDAAAQHARRGAEAFATPDFPAAKSAWEAAALATTALVDGLPQRLQAALDQGHQALESGELATATRAYQQALQLEPGNATATAGLQRIDRAPALRAKLDTAFRLEQAGDLAAARAALREALALDPDSQQARENLARLDTQAADAEFRRELAAALSALDQGELDRAERALARARQLRAQDPGVRAAGQRLAEARRVAQLAQLRQRADTQAAAEDWTGAAASYRSALQIDASLVFAAEGLARAEPRAQLASQLQRLIDEPKRLHSPAVMQEAESLLAQARQVGDAGPALRAQIAALEQARAAAAQPVTVELVSDGQTEVTIYRVGQLGRFVSNTATLKPGRYVAVGSRPGYVDVRREFEVGSGSGDLRIDIRCTETL